MRLVLFCVIDHTYIHSKCDVVVDDLLYCSIQHTTETKWYYFGQESHWNEFGPPRKQIDVLFEQIVFTTLQQTIHTFAQYATHKINALSRSRAKLLIEQVCFVVLALFRLPQSPSLPPSISLYPAHLIFSSWHFLYLLVYLLIASPVFVSFLFCSAKIIHCFSYSTRQLQLGCRYIVLYSQFRLFPFGVCVKGKLSTDKRQQDEREQLTEYRMVKRSIERYQFLGYISYMVTRGEGGG